MASKSDRPLAEAFKNLFSPSEVIEYAVIDAFSESPFGGNPAAVVLLSEWRDDKWLQNVASEFNLSETAYLVKILEKEVKGEKLTPDNEEVTGGKEGSEEKAQSKSDKDSKAESIDDSDSKPDPKLVIHQYELRWFTPAKEVDLCGHATLASAYLLFYTGVVGKQDTIFFHAKGGLLSARSVGPEESDIQNDFNEGREKPKEEMVELNFPWITTTPSSTSVIDAIPKTLSKVEVEAVGKASNYLIVELASNEDVYKLQPDMQELLNIDSEGFIATAPGGKDSGFDFVSRCFFPKAGINEDPVTGSAHSILAPYWSTKLEKNHLLAHQASKRGGTLAIQVDKKIGRVYIRGQSAIVMTGVLVK